MDLPLSDAEFRLFQSLIRDEVGIALTDFKRPLLQARLGKKVRELRLGSYRQYYDYLIAHGPAGEERRRFINAITTNKTAFFRERHHFDLLGGTWLAARRRAVAAGTAPRRLRIWSAGCATGEEPYSIAMTVIDAVPDVAQWDVRILASDIDSDALRVAARAEYPRSAVAGASEPILRRYLRGRRNEPVHVVESARRLITFRRINLLDDPWPIRTTFDCVFVRNVLIYFDRAMRERLIGRFIDVLHTGGLLFLGHSESLLGTNRPLRARGHTVYERL